MPRTDRLATVIAGAIVLAVVAGLGILGLSIGTGAMRYVMNEDRFVVAEIEVTGAKALLENDILSRAMIKKNVPILDLDLAVIADRIRDHPRIADVVVERHLPRKIVIAITERTPIGLVQKNGAIEGIDASGRFIPLIPAREDVKGPIMTGEVKERSDLVLEALAVIELLRPDLISRISEIRIDPTAGITLLTTETVTVIRLGRGEMSDKIERLRAAFKIFDQKGESKEYIDLRFQDMVTRP